MALHFTLGENIVLSFFLKDILNVYFIFEGGDKGQRERRREDLKQALR